MKLVADQTGPGEDDTPTAANDTTGINPTSVRSSAPAAHEIMSTWTEEESWELPDPCDLPFAIRALCPGVVEHLVRAKHFSTRDLRAILVRIRSNADHRDPHAAYNAILDITERKPWLWPFLETLAMSERTQDKPHVRRKGHNSVVYGKFPLHKMRLDLNKHLKSRLPELLDGSPVEPEIGFAAFAEYAVQQYFQTIKGWTPKEMAEKTWDATLPHASLKYLQDIAAKNSTPEHWVRFAIAVAEASDFRTDIASREKLSLLRLTLDGLFTSVANDDVPSIFEAISHVAGKCAAVAHLLEGQSTLELQQSLAELGILSGIQAIPPARLKLIRQAFETGALTSLINGLSQAASTDAELAGVRAQITFASENDDFDQVATLSAVAKSLKEAAAEQTEVLQKRLHCIQAFAESPNVNSEEFTILFGLTHYENIDLSIDDQELQQGETDQDVFEDDLDIDQTDIAAVEDCDKESSDDLLLADVLEIAPPLAFETAPTDEASERLDELSSVQPFSSTPKIEKVEVAVRDSMFDNSEENLMQLVPAETSEMDTPSTNAEPNFDTVPEGVLVDLISRNLLGVAADGAEALEANGVFWPIEASALCVAAASRTLLREYGADTQRFLSMVSRAESERPGALGSALLVGSIIRPAIMSRQSSFRSSIAALTYGALGTHLQETVEAIAALEFDFPPSSDNLAQLAGSDRVPLKRRLSQSLSDWCEAFARKTARWPFVTMFMHHQASPSGLIGEARKAIDADTRDAALKAWAAINGLGTQSAIDASAREYDLTTSKPGSKLHPKGLEYLHRQFDEPLGILDAWIRATEADGTHGRQSETRLRSTVGNLHSRLSKASAALRLENQRQPDTLEGVVADWVAGRLDEAISALEGGEVKGFATLDEAITADRDFLPATLRDEVVDPVERSRQFIKVLSTASVPDASKAFVQARNEGAFETAARLANRFNLDHGDSFRSEISAFSVKWLAEIESRKRRLKTISRVDYSHQEEIGRRLLWCDSAIARLEANRGGGQFEDLSDVTLQVGDLDTFIDLIANTARDAQRDRINQYRTEINNSDADQILASLDKLTLEAIEDRIAQLRDGRSAAIFDSEFDDIISTFTPSFVGSAADPSWPKTASAYRDALADSGPLFVDEDRRSASLLFISHYLDVVQSINGGTPAMQKVQRLFEEIGFEKVKTHEPKRIGSGRLWHANISAEIRSDGWFLPPIFGSRSTGKFTLLLVAPDILPEAVMKCLDTETPAILVLCGVADFARRREFAERLRANAIPVLFIDEALISFAATRRDTRARTIFECGLPYGRITPYVTDAGTVPEEMFFGRKHEIRTIMSKTSDGCLVYGGRQLGKSALLNHIEATRHDPANKIIVVKLERKALGDAEKASEIWSHLKAMLPAGIVKSTSRDAESIAHDIQLWCLTYPEGRIICMFDESDNFMTADTRAGYPELSRLKVLMEDTNRAFKVIFAGTHNVQRMHRQSNSPLAHLGNPICIGPLSRSVDDKRAAYELIIAPMKAAGFRFESIQAVEEVLAWANYYPSLIQEYGKGLLASLHGAGSGKTYKLADGEPLWDVATEMLFGHLGFQAIAARVRQKFHWTLELDPRYAVVANTLAYLNLEGNEDQSLVTGFTPAELREQVLEFWPRSTEQPSIAAFEALLEEMFDLGVLGRVAIANSLRFRYLLRTQQVAAMLGSRVDIDHALLEFADKDPSVAYDRSVYRRRYRYGTGNIPNDWPYSPLTDLQIERIVSDTASGIQIVCGIDLLGLNNVGKAIKYLIEQGKSSGASYGDLSVVIAEQVADIRKWIDGRGETDAARTIVIYTPSSARNANDLIQLCDAQPKIIAGEIRPLILLDAADPEMRAIAIRRKDQSQYLEAWGGMMIRNHLHQIECTQLDRPKLRADILSKTGGIPSETVKLIAAMVLHDKPEEILSDWSYTIKLPSNLVTGPIADALRIIELGGDDYATLDSLIREETGQDLITLGPDLVATGLARDWNPKVGRINLSALGELVAQSLEE